MLPTEEEIARLLLKEITNSITPEEKKILQQWTALSSQNQAKYEELIDLYMLKQRLYEFSYIAATIQKKPAVQINRSASTVQRAPLARVSDPCPESTPVAHRVHFLKTAWFRYAAVVLLLAGGYWIYTTTDHRRPATDLRSAIADIQPGTNRATLTIGDQTVDLSSDKTGVVMGTTTISYTDGTGIERLSVAGRRWSVVHLSTPAGGQYQAILPDGSKVWLNAASSIRFPSEFDSSRREVEITGEAYLEVAKNTRQPFFVRTGKATIHVLGTSFNVNTYEDERTEKITLIEGSVRITPNAEGLTQKGVQRSAFSIQQKSEVLKPGQQAILTHNSQLTTHSIDRETTTAWKKGMFKFNEASIEEVMRQLSRWYNLEVNYEGKVDAHFIATISRDVPISKIFRMLESTKAVRFKIEGNRVTVKP